MKSLIKVFKLIVVILCAISCDPKESQLEGPRCLYIIIENRSGIDLYEKDNWGRCDDVGNLFPSSRIIKNDNPGDILWNPMGGDLWNISEVMDILKTKQDNAFVELYSCDSINKTPIQLLKRWSLNDEIEGHHIFNVDCYDSENIITYEASRIFHTFTILPEDIGLSE